MRRSLAALVAGLAVALAVAGVAAADDGGRPLSTALTGAEEAPGPGDSNATGQADLRLNQGQKEVCFDISWPTSPRRCSRPKSTWGAWAPWGR